MISLPILRWPRLEAVEPALPKIFGDCPKRGLREDSTIGLRTLHCDRWHDHTLRLGQSSLAHAAPHKILGLPVEVRITRCRGHPPTGTYSILIPEPAAGDSLICVRTDILRRPPLSDHRGRVGCEGGGSVQSRR